MPTPFRSLQGEFRRSLDDRYRLSLPVELIEPLTVTPTGESAECILTKERSGCLSLWSQTQAQARLESGVQLIESKLQAGRLDGRIDEVQALGRLLSTRNKIVQIAGRGRLSIPEGFREFLGVEQGGEVMVVGAALCVEIWRPTRWIEYLEERMPQFRQLLDDLSG